MNVAMFTNTFTPHVGGVARSVQGLADGLRRHGHRVLVVAPRFSDRDEVETDVLRMPAIRRFHGSEFSLPVPAPARVARAIEAFRPDIVHSHHPFLLGDTALRVAAAGELPVVFTHHTRYEQYTHYLPGDSTLLKTFVIALVSGYCNLCDTVIAPSGSIADMLRQQGVKPPLAVVPTGVAPLHFTGPEDGSSRRRLGIPEEAFVVGHVGRLAPEKNLAFLVDAVARFLLGNPAARFLLIGEGPTREEMLNALARQDLIARTQLLGILSPRDLAEAYRCMDVFVFASRSETQGMVLAEAMAAGTPVVAIDAPGVRDIVVDTINGRLLTTETTGDFLMALEWLAQLPADRRTRLRQNARLTAEQFSQERGIEKILKLYAGLLANKPASRQIDQTLRQRARRRIARELAILSNYGHALKDALLRNPRKREPPRPPN